MCNFETKEFAKDSTIAIKRLLAPVVNGRLGCRNATPLIYQQRSLNFLLRCI
jgi:hypothetical protein